jgi:hypothetical protein
LTKSKKEKIEGLEHHKQQQREKELQRKEKKQALITIKHGSKR